MFLSGELTFAGALALRLVTCRFMSLMRMCDELVMKLNQLGGLRMVKPEIDERWRPSVPKRMGRKTAESVTIAVQYAWPRPGKISTRKEIYNSGDKVITINHALPIAVDADILTAKAPEETGTLERILEHLARPDRNVIAKVDGTQNGKVNVFEKGQVEGAGDRVVVAGREVDGAAIVAAVGGCQNGRSGVLVARRDSADPALAVITGRWLLKVAGALGTGRQVGW